ncbi:PREDICTED: uncharacterized protein LOC104605693 [Nelumbo nucifera]|uniref:Uncharacterized protein LOC104605693 n=1 Tax=Nelumbo nucifera TaxID=4432 RepID=A0A1U8B043_NELNU|nr:PREDICTED: uncharacterized protein LOC104605693 [Nelumbo nucifera]XP_010268851.1 PREDICTED: uncharacterized protein LOC104605693 [Nelumbo nucifera]
MRFPFRFMASFFVFWTRIPPFISDLVEQGAVTPNRDCEQIQSIFRAEQRAEPTSGEIHPCSIRDRPTSSLLPLTSFSYQSIQIHKHNVIPKFAGSDVSNLFGTFVKLNRHKTVSHLAHAPQTSSSPPTATPQVMPATSALSPSVPLPAPTPVIATPASTTVPSS